MVYILLTIAAVVTSHWELGCHDGALSLIWSSPVSFGEAKVGNGLVATAETRELLNQSASTVI